MTDRRKTRFVGWLMPGAVSVVLVATAAHAQPAHGGPTLAVEDTMRTSVPQVLVRAPRVTLDEILDRVARGEARRESLLTDQSFVVSFRALRHDRNDSLRLVRETVVKVYKKRPDKSRAVQLRDWEPKQDDKKKKVTVEVQSDYGSDMREEIVNFAFRPEGRRDYKFRIAGRDLVGDHLVYRIAFSPRSAIDVENPHGMVWVDTNEFVIVRQEITWPRSPVPLLLKSLPRMVIERTKVNGHWVLHRMLARIELTLPVPQFGRTFDVVWLFSDYTVNTGLSDDLFPARGKSTAPVKGGAR